MTEYTVPFHRRYVKDPGATELRAGNAGISYVPENAAEIRTRVAEPVRLSGRPDERFECLNETRQIFGHDLPDDVIINAEVVCTTLCRIPTMFSQGISGWIAVNSRDTWRAASPIT